MRRPDSKDGLVSLIDISSRSPSHFTPPEVVTKRYAARLLARSNDTPTMAQVLIIYKQKRVIASRNGSCRTTQYVLLQRSMSLSCV